MKAYLTTYCNRAHCLDTGKPVNHECRVLPPAALEAERQGLLSEALRLILNDQDSGGMRIHKGLHVSGARKRYKRDRSHGK